ncbi:MAG TPA: hypothetical protein VFG05_05880 [Methylocella sp.]|nr:hypothetical protein [Methylocella sp.]
MRSAFLASAACALITVASIHAQAAPKTIQFPLKVAGGAASCLPSATGNVIDHSFGEFENLEVVVKGLPPNTAFDLFSIQVPNPPFGLAWYIGDIVTDERGVGVGNFTGRFNIETFVVSPGAAPSPQVFTKPPFPNAATGVTVAPVQLYHLGLWFNSPADAAKAGCASTVTPFNGEHNAGIQVLNTGSFPDLKGPLFYLK